MNKITTKISIFAFSFIFALMILFGGVQGTQFVFAQENQENITNINIVETQNTENETIILANVNIYDAKIVSQENNIFKISFDIANGDGAQAQIKYLVRLLKIDEISIDNNGTKSIVKTQTLVHEKVYDDPVSVSENSRVSKTVEYIAPKYLNGTYQIWVVAQNENGLMLGLSVLGDVEIKGDGGYMEIIPSSCFLRVDGLSDKYTLGQGVDIKEEESLTMYCNIKNNFDNEVTATPSFETRFRSVTGDIAPTNTVDNTPIVFVAGEEKEVSIKLPKAFSPQAYHILFTLKNDKGESISNTVQPHYVLRGGSATIQNIILDKDFYKKGDTANISFIWTPSADSFDGSRFGATELDDIYLNMELVDSKGNICAERVENMKLGTDALGRISIEKNINKECFNPAVMVSIVDATGNTLDKKDFSVKSPKSEILEKNNTNIIIAVIIIIAVLIIFIILRIFTKRNGGNNSVDGSGMVLKSIIFLIFFAGAFAMHVDRVDAVTLTHSSAVWVANINKNTFSPGEMITITGAGTAITCNNTYLGVRTLMKADGNVIFDVMAYSDVWGYYGAASGSGSVSFPAPVTPGNYVVEIYAASIDVKGRVAPATASIPYTVVATAPTVNITASPSLIQSGESSTLSWTSENTNSCIASGGWSGAKTTSGSENTGILTSDKTYTLTCMGEGGIASDSVTVSTLQPTEVDIGLRISDGSQTYIVAGEPLGTLTSPLRVADENGNIYGVRLVDSSDPKAIPVFMKVNGVIKALKELEGASVYSWQTGDYGSCGAPQETIHNEIVYDGNDGCGQRITKVKTTSTFKTRSVLCKTDDGQVVDDAFCSGIKPDTSIACTTTIQYRMWANDMWACGGGAGPVRWYKGLDTNAGSYEWDVTYYDHGWYTRTGSGTKAEGVTQINTGVQTHQGSTGRYLNLTF